MKVAHLLLVHKEPQQVERLLNAMDHPSFDFYIHVDKKSDIRPFIYLNEKKNVFFIKNRAKIFWAGYGTIQATLNGFKEILPKSYDYLNIISGQDFPLKPATYIFNYLVQHKGTEFISCESVFGPTWSEASTRVKVYSLINWRIPGKFKLEKIINKILPARRFPLNYEIVGRANWFTITSKAASYIIDFLNDHPKVIRFFKYCWGADELIFSTILFNSSFQHFIKENLVYVDWNGPHPGHPNLLTMSDFHQLSTTEKLFARKFDMNIDETILVKLEELIQG